MTANRLRRSHPLREELTETAKLTDAYITSGEGPPPMAHHAIVAWLYAEHLEQVVIAMVATMASSRTLINRFNSDGTVKT